MKRHTSTPWRVGNAGHGIFPPDCGTHTIGDFRRGADARHAVRCVNERDELLRMLEMLVELRDDPIRYMACGSYRLEAARELIDKAKGEEFQDARH